MVNKIPRHIFRYIEGELYDYPINYKKLIALKSDYYNSTPQGDGSGIRGNSQASMTESKVMQILNDREVQRLERSVRALEDVIDTLSPDEMKLLNLKYFRNTHTNEGVRLELHIASTRTYYTLKNNIIRKIAVRYGVM